MERRELLDRILAQVQRDAIQPYEGRIPFGPGRGSANAVMFKVTCGCGVSAMLSVDVPPDSADDKILEMVPHLAGVLDRQVEQFYRIPCEAHARMSIK